MKRLLKTLRFHVDDQPSQADQARLAIQIAGLLQRAKAIGKAHASDEAEESDAWGGVFADVFASAQQIVSNFVSKIADWIAGQDAEDLDEGEIEAEVADLAETVGDTEVASAIEQSVLDELSAQGYLEVAWAVQPSACPLCLENASVSPIPIGTDWPSGDKTPPAHPRCRCSLTVVGEGG